MICFRVIKSPNKMVNNYVFKQVYAFSVEANSLARGFPRNIREVFPAVVSGDHPDGNIDAAYFSYTHNAVFLLKGSLFWQVVGSRHRWRRPSLPRNGLLPHKEVERHWFDICNVHPTALKLTRWGWSCDKAQCTDEAWWCPWSSLCVDILYSLLSTYLLYKRQKQ